MSLFKQYKTDENKTSNGVPIVLHEAANEDGTLPTFYISRMSSSNKGYQKTMEAKTRSHRRALQLGTMPEEMAQKINIEVFCEAVLKGWSNIYAEDGSPLVFSKSAAINLMGELPDLYERLSLEAQNIENFRAAALEEEAKNY